MAWLTGYGYRKKKPVNATAAGEQTVYQKKLLVGESSGASGEEIDCESHCHDFPNDIRFTGDDEQTKHDYWVESISGETPNRLAIIWIEVASIPSEGTVDLYMYYGKSADSGESDGDNTFEFFDDFYVVPTAVDYFVKDVAYYGASTDIFGPQATYFNGKTYISLHGNNLDPYAIEYNHSIGEWSDDVYVGNNPLGDDGHGSPSILRDSLGYLHIFYGCHIGYIQHAKSTNPNDISAWTDKGDIGGGANTYPSPILANNGDIYLISRTQHASSWFNECFIKSVDNGENWSTENDIIDFGTGYVIYMGRPDYQLSPETIHVAWVRYNYGVSKYQNAYYAKYNISNGHMYAADGSDLGTSVDLTEATNSCLIATGDSIGRAYVREHDGIPYVIINDNSNFKFTKWTGAVWTALQTITTTSTLQMSFDFIVHSATNIEAYFDTGNDIEKWSYNGSTWSKDSTIAYGSDYNNNLLCPAIVHNHTDDLKITFSQGLAGNNNKGFAYGDSGFVGLPPGGGIGEVPIGWTESNTPVATFRRISGPKGQFDRISDWSGDAGPVYRPITKIETNNDRCIEFIVKDEALPSQTYHYIRFKENSESSDFGILLIFANDGNLGYYDGSWHTLQTYSQNTEYRFKIYNIDYTNNQFDIDINGVNKGTNLSFAGGQSFFEYIVLDGSAPESWEYMLMDYSFFFTRNYASPEPTWGTSGGEQQESVTIIPVGSNTSAAGMLM